MSEAAAIRDVACALDRLANNLGVLSVCVALSVLAVLVVLFPAKAARRRKGRGHRGT